MRVCVMVLLALTAPSFADDSGEARRQFEHGLARYNLREYRDAIAAFAEAYRLRPDPAFLYNLAQAHRLADHPDEALHFYHVYLRAWPHAPNRHEVETRIADLEQLAAAHQKVEQPPDNTLAPAVAPRPSPIPQVLAPPTPAPVAVLVQPPSPKRVWRRWWFWTAIAGVVVVGAAVGAGVGLSERHKPDGLPAVSF